MDMENFDTKTQIANLKLVLNSLHKISLNIGCATHVDNMEIVQFQASLFPVTRKLEIMRLLGIELEEAFEILEADLEFHKEAAVLNK
jgi:hypothetical protein